MALLAKLRTMPKVKKTKAEVLEYVKEAQRRRRENIKQDPELYAKAKEKERNRYHRRKSEGKILLINQVSPQQRNVIRKRNRDAFRAFYQRKRQQEQVETIEDVCVIKSEPQSPEIVINMPEEERDPLRSSVGPGPSRYRLRSARKEKCTSESKLTLSSLTEHECTSLTKQTASPNMSSCLSPKGFNKRHEESDAPSGTDYVQACNTQQPTTNTNVKELISEFSEDIDVDVHISSLCPSPVPSSPASPNSSTATSYTASIVQTPKRKRKTMSLSLKLKRIKYRANKEIHRLRRKLYEANCRNEKLRHQVHRLKNMKSNKDHARQRKNKMSNVLSQECDLGTLTINDISKDVEHFLEHEENSRICAGKKGYVSSLESDNSVTRSPSPK